MSDANQGQDQCRIVGISGSLRPGSYTRMAVALALKGAEELKCVTALLDLRDYQLVFCDGKEACGTSAGRSMPGSFRSRPPFRRPGANSTRTAD